jgi:predicted transcriptional regulator of viral defense system
MNFIEFRDNFYPLACFSLDQIYSAYPQFDRTNLTRWIRQGYIARLRQGYYTFPDYKSKRDFSLYFANRIYKPSYISLHTALSFYGMIPEAVSQITSVTSLKTAAFRNDFGDYSYKNIKGELMFGYELKEMDEKRRLMFATPEKALLDLLYLYPFYDSEKEMEELRIDEYYMREDLNVEMLMSYNGRFRSKALDKRTRLLQKVYNF